MFRVPCPACHHCVSSSPARPGALHLGALWPCRHAACHDGCTPTPTQCSSPWPARRPASPRPCTRARWRSARRTQRHPLHSLSPAASGSSARDAPARAPGLLLLLRRRLCGGGGSCGWLQRSWRGREGPPGRAGSALGGGGGTCLTGVRRGEGAVELDEARHSRRVAQRLDVVHHLVSRVLQTRVDGSGSGSTPGEHTEARAGGGRAHEPCASRTRSPCQTR